jgi:hypothetical protein
VILSEERIRELSISISGWNDDADADAMVLKIIRETAEACAKICMEILEQYNYYHWYEESDAARRCAEEIRAAAQDKERK